MPRYARSERQLLADLFLTERVRGAVAARPYAELVEQVRRPPWWSPSGNRLTDELANLMEFFIHHEDVRRAQPDWRPRELAADVQAGLWRRLRPMIRWALRRFPGTVLVQAPGHGELTAGRSGESLRLVGSPSELALFFSGRQRAARVQLDGSAALAERLRTAKLGV
jgi:uncharacterized protein (TIGR03085 family)